MKATIASLLIVLCVTACSDTTATAPDRSIVSAGRPSAATFLGDPPPPPMSADSYASTEFGVFAFQATYFFNRPGNNGWISFVGQQPAGVVTANARIDYHQGQVSGKGTISFIVSGGVVTVDLAHGLSDKTATFNESCGQSGCASVGFSGTFTNKLGVTSPTSGRFAIGGSEVPIASFGQ